MRYTDSKTAVAAANGRASIRWAWEHGGPLARLNVQRISVRTNSVVPPEAQIYSNGIESQANFIAGSFTGHNDTAVFPDGHLLLAPFEPILILWVECAPGDQCTASIEGTY